MFGASNNSFGGFGTNNQQPQQPQTGGIFGAAQPATGGFNAFGQPQQQAAAPIPFGQPASTGFGANTFGASTSASPFGAAPAATNAFGQPQQNTSNLFGAPAQTQPAASSSFGGFGAPAASNTFGGFGAAAPAANNTNTGTGLFGAKPATNTFGAATTGFGSTFGQTATPSPFGATNTVAAQNGTANPLYAPHTMVENESTPSQKSTFNSIVAMDAYKNWSFEELRFQDYTQGRKTAVPTNTLGGAFGAQQPQQQQTGFGGFGATANTNQAGGFNQPQQQTGLFGNAAPAGNAFGTQAPTNNIFGQPAAATTNTFGQAQNTTNSPFGAPAAQPSNAFGGNSLFNSNPTSNAFGAQPAKPSIFGNTNNTFGAATPAPATNNLFGQNTTQPQGGLFGAQANQNQPSTGLFGQTNNANTGTTGLFGANNTQNTAAKPGGLFGSTGQTNSPFGQPQANQGATANPFGFGQNNQQTAQPGTGGLFGNNAQPAQNSGGGLFGNTNNAQQQQQPAQSGGLFGNTGTNNNNNLFGAPSGGLFGNNNNNNNNNNNAAGGLFGQKPLNNTNSLFGNKPATQPNTNNFSNPAGGGLFGPSQAAPGFSFGNNNNNNSSLFGSSSGLQNSQQGASNGLFQSQQSNQPMLQAQIDQGAYGNNPIFANHGNSGGSRPAIPIKKTLPTIDFKPIPRPNTKITKLRGFARSTSPAKSINSGSPMAASHSSSNMASTVSRSSAYGRPAEETLLSPKAFIVRPSPKKLTIDPNTLFSMLRDRSATLNGSPGPIGSTPPPRNPAKSNNPPVFDPDAEAAAHQTFSRNYHTAQNTQSVADKSSHHSKAAGTPMANKSPTHTINSQTNSPRVDKSVPQDGSSALGDTIVVTTKEKAKAGEYWTVPAIQDLQLLSRRDLKSVPNFLVGRKGFGQIQFQEDVDLTGIPNLEDDLCGEVIVFKQSLCSVYPDDPLDKPPVGEGLNVPAVITLDNCWALDKATREPIKDPSHARVKQFTKRLMKSEDTKFIEYNAKNGQWTFMVEHFTTYGIDDSEEDSDDGHQATGGDEDTENEDQFTSSEDSSDQPQPKAVRYKRSTRPAPDKGMISEEDDGPPQMMLFGDEDEAEQGGQVFDVSDGSDRSDDGSHGDSISCITGSDGDDVPINPLGKKRPREVSDSAEDSQSNMEPPSRSQNWRSQLGIESKKVAVMQASLFAGPAPVHKPKPAAVARSHYTERHAGNISRQALTVPKPQILSKTNDHQMEDISSTPQYPSKTIARDTNLLKKRVPAPKRYSKQIPFSKSILYGHEGSSTNIPLALARSFRISWSNRSDQLIHFKDGHIGNMLKSELPSVTGSELITRTVPTSTFALSKEIEAAECLLKVQLHHTSIHTEEGIPIMTTNPQLRFRHFIVAHQKTDRSNDLNVWRLCSALYDELDLRLPKGAAPEVIERIKSVRREDSFSQWLQRTVLASVEQDLRSSSANEETQSPFRGIFKLLTGNQIERACNASIQANNYRLATLLAQCGRSDPSFKSDILQQNIVWHELRTDAYIDRDLRKIYELMSGNVTFSRGFGNKSLHVDHSDDIKIAEHLDWKRNLGIHFWFQASHGNFWNAVKTYEEAFSKDSLASPPLPWYIEKQDRSLPDTLTHDWKTNPQEPIHDAMFHLIKMFVDSTYGLETVLEPKGFGPSPFDYRMPWHLYNVLSRVIRVRDFEDREIIIGDMDGDDEGAVEGNSATADILTTNYACQLSRLGLHKWAVFILLHLELPERRKAAVENYLSKNIQLLDTDTETFLKKTLKIPSCWIYTARAELAQYENRLYDQYRWLIKAEKFTDAHRVVVNELAPEAVIRGDLSELKRLFEGLSSDNVADWPSGGKIFLEYVKVVEQLPILLRKTVQAPIQSNHELKFLLESILPNLLREIPLLYDSKNLRGIAGNSMKQEVCMNEMMSNLTNTSTSVSLVIHKYDYTNDFINLKDLQESDKLLWTQRCAVNGFVKALRRSGSQLV